MTLELVPWRGAQVPLLSAEVSRSFGLDQYLQMVMSAQGYMGPPAPVTLYGNRPAEQISQSFEGFTFGMLYQDGPVASVEQYRVGVFGQAPLLYQQIADGRPGDFYDDEALERLRHPWPGGSLSDLAKRGLVYGDLAGNAFVVDLEDELVLLRPDWVEIVLTKRMHRGAQVGWKQVGIMYYEGGLNTGEGVPFLPGEYAHFVPGLPDPLATYRGMSWLTPLVREVKADKAAGDHKVAWFENAASVNVAVSLPKEITAAQFDQFVDRMDSQHKGSQNAGKTLYTGGGADVTVIGANMQQADFASIVGKGENRVANAGRVPAVLLGFSEGLGGSSLNAGNYTAAKRNFVDTTCRDLWQNWAQSLQQMDAFQPPTPKARLWYDGRDIPFLHEDAEDLSKIQQSRAGTINTYVTAGFTPDSAVLAVAHDDVTLLEHTGLTSVQLLPPGSPGEPTVPGGAPTPDGPTPYGDGGGDEGTPYGDAELVPDADGEVPYLGEAQATRAEWLDDEEEIERRRAHDVSGQARVKGGDQYGGRFGSELGGNLKAWLAGGGKGDPNAVFRDADGKPSSRGTIVAAAKRQGVTVPPRMSLPALQSALLAKIQQDGHVVETKADAPSAPKAAGKFEPHPDQRQFELTVKGRQIQAAIWRHVETGKLSVYESQDGQKTGRAIGSAPDVAALGGWARGQGHDDLADYADEQNAGPDAGSAPEGKVPPSVSDMVERLLRDARPSEVYDVLDQSGLDADGMREVAGRLGVDVPDTAKDRHAVAAFLAGTREWQAKKPPARKAAAKVEAPTGDAARDRQARIDTVRPVADLLAEAAQLRNDDADPAVLRRRLEQSAERDHLPASLVDDVLTDPDRIAQQHGLTRVSGPAGAVEPYDPARHKAIGSGVKTGQSVTVIRPVYGYDPGDGEVNLGRAAVEEADDADLRAPEATPDAGPVGSSDRLGQLEGRIRTIYAQFAKTRHGPVLLKDIRDQMPDVGRDELDQALVALYRTRRLDLQPRTMRAELSGDQQAAGMFVGGETKHQIVIVGVEPGQRSAELPAAKKMGPKPTAGKATLADIRSTTSREDAEALLAKHTKPELVAMAKDAGVPPLSARATKPTILSAILDEVHGDTSTSAPDDQLDEYVTGALADLARDHGLDVPTVPGENDRPAILEKLRAAGITDLPDDAPLPASDHAFGASPAHMADLAAAADRPLQLSPELTGRGRQRNQRLDDLRRRGLLRRRGDRYSITDRGRAELADTATSVDAPNLGNPTTPDGLDSMDVPARQVEVENRIRKAFVDAQAAGAPGPFGQPRSGRPPSVVMLPAIREQVGDDVSREELDAALVRLQRDPDSGVTLFPQEDQKHLTPAQRAAAVRFGDASYHGVSVTPANPDGLDGMDVPALQAGHTARHDRLRVLAGQKPATVDRLSGGAGVGGGVAELQTYPDGERIVVKRYTASDPKPYVDAEELGARVIEAVGGRTAAVVRLGPDRIAEEHVEGRRGTHAVPERILGTDSARRLGLADLLMDHSDRNEGNWFEQPDGSVIAIDNGGAWYGDGDALWGGTTPFAQYLVTPKDPAHPGAHRELRDRIDLPPAYLAEVRRNLEDLRPEFERLGRTRWHDQMMGRLAAVEQRATPPNPDGLDAMDPPALRNLATEWEVPNARTASKDDLIRDLRQRGAVSPQARREQSDATVDPNSPERQAAVETAVRDAYRRALARKQALPVQVAPTGDQFVRENPTGFIGAADKPNRAIDLADLRRELGDQYSRGEVDAALRRLNLGSDVRVIGDFNQKALTPEQQDAHTIIGNQRKHLIEIDPTPQEQTPADFGAEAMYRDLIARRTGGTTDPAMSALSDAVMLAEIRDRQSRDPLVKNAIERLGPLPAAAAPGARPKAKPAVRGTPALSDADVEQRVLSAYRDLTQRARQGESVSLADLRDRLPDVDRDQVDRVLTGLNRRNGIRLTPTSRDLTPRGQDGGVRIGGHDAHEIRVEPHLLPPAPPVDTSRDAKVEAKLRDIYTELAAEPGQLVSLTDLRARLADEDPVTVDRALTNLSRQPGVRLIPESNQKALRPEDREAAVVIGNQYRHLIAIAPTATPGGGARLGEEALPQPTAPDAASPRPAAWESRTDRAAQVARSAQSPVAETKGYGGFMGGTDRETHADGSVTIHKQPTDASDGGPTGAGARQADAEELGSLVASAVGMDAPAVYRVGPTDLHMEFMGGAHIDHLSIAPWKEPPPEVVDSDQGRLLGLLDILIGNPDRHSGNWLLRDDGGIVPIDHAMAFGRHGSSGLGYFSAAYSNEAHNDWADQIDMSPADMALIHERLDSLRGEFDRLQRQDWWQAMMENLEIIESRSSGTKRRVR